MPSGRRPDQRLEDCREFIIKLYTEDNATLSEICDELASLWRVPVEQGAKTRTLRRRLKQWGVLLRDQEDAGQSARSQRARTLKRPAYYDDQDLIKELKELRKLGLDNDSMLRHLQPRWPDLTSKNLSRIRLEHKVNLRTLPGDREAAQAEADRIVREQLESGTTAGYGWTYSVPSAKLSADGFISQKHVKNAVRKHDKEGIEYRAGEKARKRGQYRVDGPNQVWSCDGYDKLSPFGFQIYGIIDAYSRKIIHVFVGISNRTAAAVQKYFLMAVKEYGFPVKLRTDMGTETVLMAECQGYFREEQEGIELETSSFHLFGPSVHNTRIEPWWGKLASAVINPWRELFQQYENNNEFQRLNRWDIMALRYVYMDLLRKSCNHFIDTWNVHTIRHQKNRPYLPTGKVWSLYHDPPEGVKNFATQPSHELLDMLMGEVNDWDPDRYLDESVMKFCATTLQKNGLPSRITKATKEDGTHHKAYILLREKLKEHELQHGSFKDCRPPKGRTEWRNENLREKSGRLKTAIEKERQDAERGHDAWIGRSSETDATSSDEEDQS